MSEQKLKMPEGLTALLVGRPSKVVTESEPKALAGCEQDAAIAIPKPQPSGELPAAPPIPSPVEPLPPVPVEESPIAMAHRHILGAARQLQLECEAALKLDPADLFARSAIDHAKIVIHEIATWHNWSQVDDEVPERYRMAQNHGQVNPNAALTGYGEVSTKSTWSRR